MIGSPSGSAPVADPVRG